MMKQFVMMIFSSSLLLFSGSMMEQNVFGQTNETMKFTIVVGTPPAPQQAVFSGDGVEIAIADAAGSEGDGAIVFPVSLSQASAQPVTCRYTLMDGTAAAGRDYTASAGMLSLPAGATTAEIEVGLLDDGFHEEEECFTVELSDVSGATVARGAAVGTIRDDDALPALTVLNAAASENSEKMVFTVQLNGASAEPVSVEYATRDVSGSEHPAAANIDYAPAAGTLTFSAGSVSATIEVTLMKDANNDEGDEFFHLVLSNPVNATLRAAQAVGTVQNGAGHAGGPGSGTSAAVPEPSTVGLLLIGLLGLRLAARRRSRFHSRP